MSSWSDNEILALVSVLFVEALALAAAVHVIMNKRDPKVAAGWSALIFFIPALGTLLYWLFGINRIDKKARKIYDPKKTSLLKPPAPEDWLGTDLYTDNFQKLSALTGRLSPFPLQSGNSFHPLVNGDEAYPEMLSAIEGARKFILLSTYIFDNDQAGREFVRALKQAAARGVKVRVLVDDIGARYSFPSIVRQLRSPNLKARRFHRVMLPWLFNYSQLRSHRKLMVVDGEVGFIGGMNIRIDHELKRAMPKKRTQDLHFKFTGPLLRDACEVFKQDWRYTAREDLDLGVIEPAAQGYTRARMIPNNPKENLGEHRWTILGAIASAKERICVVTPYFLPDQEIISALGSASLRGVKVEILLPQKNNHAIAHWACMANLWQVLETGCEVSLSRPPFDHSKLMVVDRTWSFIGSSNWDARSLRLNFELNVECYSESFAAQLLEIFERKKNFSNPLAPEQLDKRPFPVKLRDNIARLFTPYL